MRRQLKTLNQILDYKLADLRLFGRAELKGPILNVLLERLPGDVVDTLQVMEVVRNAVEASLLQGLRKVNIYLWCRGQAEEAPEWSGDFVVEPLVLAQPDEPLSRASSYRQDYPGMRVLFFCLGICLSGFYVLGGVESGGFDPTGSGYSLGYFVPMAKTLVRCTSASLVSAHRPGTGPGIDGHLGSADLAAGLEHCLRDPLPGCHSPIGFGSLTLNSR